MTSKMYLPEVVIYKILDRADARLRETQPYL